VGGVSAVDHLESADFEEFAASLAPEVVGEAEGRIVVDPHVEPPYEHAPELHHVFVLEDGRIVEMRDYPNRRAALEAVGL
jgi:ketosteroid isomerase-like protein